MMGYPGMRQNSADIILIPRGLAGGGGGYIGTCNYFVFEWNWRTPTMDGGPAKNIQIGLKCFSQPGQRSFYKYFYEKNCTQYMIAHADSTMWKEEKAVKGL